MSTCIVAARRLMGLALLVFASALCAEPGIEKSDRQEPNIAIQGYSPVSYFSRNMAEKGSPEVAIEYDGKTYLLTSQQQIEAFRENPKAYTPLFAPFCPYSLALGRQVGIEPTNFKIVDGKLLLFHNESELDGLKQWNKHGNEQELLDRTNQEYLRLKF